MHGYMQMGTERQGRMKVMKGLIRTEGFREEGKK